MTGNSEPQFFLFLSHLLGKKVLDMEGRPLGRIADLVANVTEPYPTVTEVVIAMKQGGKACFVSWNRMSEVSEGFVIESIRNDQLAKSSIGSDELLLKESMMDKQIVDTDGAKVRRVNDLQLLKARNTLYLVHVDVGFRGLMRRAGLEKPMDLLLQALFDYNFPDQFISWRFVQPLSSPDLLRLKIAQNRLAKIHPADLADIIEDLDIHKRKAVFQSLDKETAAETLEETDPKIQVSLIENLDFEDASDIIEEMSLSEAADLLGDLPRDKAEGILKEMEQDIAEDVKELLAHPEEKAGGLMTTSFLQFAPSLTTREAMDFIHREAEDIESISYLYIADVDDRLLGVVGLRELLTADFDITLSELMETRVVSVNIDEDKDQIADHFTKYGMTAIPVVDEDNRIKGVIIFKNLLEVVAPHLGK
jgi:magnesium transporter